MPLCWSCPFNICSFGSYCCYLCPFRVPTICGMYNTALCLGLNSMWHYVNIGSHLYVALRKHRVSTLCGTAHTLGLKSMWRYTAPYILPTYIPRQLYLLTPCVKLGPNRIWRRYQLSYLPTYLGSCTYLLQHHYHTTLQFNSQYHHGY